MTAGEVVARARQMGAVDDVTLSLIENDPVIIAWLDEWLPARAEGTLAMVQGVIPADIRTRIGEAHSERFKATLPLLIGLYTNAPSGT